MQQPQQSSQQSEATLVDLKGWGFLIVNAAASTQAHLPQLQIEEQVEYYDVSARDRAALAKALRVPGTEQNREVNGQTHARFEIDSRFTQAPQQCVVHALSIRLVLKVILPRWAPGAAPPRHLEKEWTWIRDRIVVHENRHRQNALDAAHAMREGFSAAMGIGDCTALSKALDRVRTNAINRQNLMDRLLDQKPVIGN